MIEITSNYKSHIEPITKEDTERAWRDSEMLRTDDLIILPDYPRKGDKQAFLDYRKALADYPGSLGFPNGERPTYNY